MPHHPPHHGHHSPPRHHHSGIGAGLELIHDLVHHDRHVPVVVQAPAQPIVVVQAPPQQQIYVPSQQPPYVVQPSAPVIIQPPPAYYPVNQCGPYCRGGNHHPSCYSYHH